MKLPFDTLIYIVYTCTRCISCIHQRFPDRTKKKKTKILLPLKFLFFSNLPVLLVIKKKFLQMYEK